MPDSGSFLLFASDHKSYCRKSELEQLSVGLGINLDAAVTFTSGNVDGREGNPELELLVEDSNEGVHFNIASC